MPPFIRHTIGGLLKKQAELLANAEAVIYWDQRIRRSWRQLDDETDLLARGLMALKIARGDHVAIWCTNRLEWLLTQLAVAKIGAVLVTLNPEWKAEELKYALKQSDSCCLVMIPGFQKESAQHSYHYNYLKILTEVLPDLIAPQGPQLPVEQLPCLRHIVIIAKEVHPGSVSWEELKRRGTAISAVAAQERLNAVQNDDLALIQYTSGTTGFPKGAMLTHYNILNNAMLAAHNMKLTAHDRLCAPVPYYHCFGSILVNLCSLVSGAATVIPCEHFDVHKTLEALRAEKCTALYGVPTMFMAELDEFAKSPTRELKLRTGIMAGAPCPVELMKAVQETLGATEMTIGYGLTEASPLTHQTTPSDSLEQRLLSVGQPLETTEAKIVDPATLEELKPGDVGEIWVRGFHVMRGYYQMPEETNKALVDGWLRTGDLGVRDHQNYYRIVGRLKEMFNVGGHKVFPAEVEQALSKLLADKIKMVQVVGIPHPKLQEVSAAVVELKEGQQLSLQELQERCRDVMEWPKVPRHLKIIDNFAPYMTVTGKIQKFKIKELLSKECQV